MRLRRPVLLAALLTSTALLGLAWPGATWAADTAAAGKAPAEAAATPTPTPASPAVAPVAAKPAKSGQPEAGAISRATGHQFREGLTASFTAEKPSMHANDSGLLTRAQDGAFSQELWTDQSARQIRDLLSKVTPAPAWPGSLTLARRVLLTDAPWPEDAELQALRVQQMVSFGAIDEAADFYNALATETPDKTLLRAGIRALLLSGEPSVACLELNAGKPKDAVDTDNDHFWSDMQTFCTALISRGEDAPSSVAPAAATAPAPAPVPAPAPTAPPTPTPAAAAAPAPTVPTLAQLTSANQALYTPTTIADLLKLNPLVLDAATSLPGLDLTKLTNTTIPDDLSPETASALARLDALPYALRLKLFARSSDIQVPGGILSTIKTNDTEWEGVATLLQQQTASGTLANAELAHRVAALPATLPLRIHSLFAPALERITPSDSFTLAEQKRIAAILLSVDSNAAAGWINKISKGVGATPTHSISTSGLLLLGQMRGYAEANTKYPLSFSQLEKDKQVRLLKIFKILSELLDTPPVFIDNPSNVYEKKTDLTRLNHYVMPWQELRRTLSEAEDKGQLGRVLLASLLTLQAQTPAEIEPDVMAIVLDKLIAMGLTEEARQIATSVLLGVIITGET